MLVLQLQASIDWAIRHFPPFTQLDLLQSQYEQIIISLMECEMKLFIHSQKIHGTTVDA